MCCVCECVCVQNHCGLLCNVLVQIIKQARQSGRQTIPIQYNTTRHDTPSQFTFRNKNFTICVQHTEQQRLQIEWIYCLMQVRRESRDQMTFLLYFSSIFGIYPSRIHTHTHTPKNTIIHRVHRICTCMHLYTYGMCMCMAYTCFQRTCTASFATGQQNPYLKLFNRCFGIIRSLPLCACTLLCACEHIKIDWVKIAERSLKAMARVRER